MNKKVSFTLFRKVQSKNAIVTLALVVKWTSRDTTNVVFEVRILARALCVRKNDREAYGSRLESGEG